MGGRAVIQSLVCDGVKDIFNKSKHIVTYNFFAFSSIMERMNSV